MQKVFIDGSAGTTGLKIEQRLATRRGISLLKLPEERRKDLAARAEMINAADLVFLCLPDEAARQAAALVRNAHTRLIDASTAHRVAPGWAYGFPELGKGAFREAIRESRRVAVPGCHASGFLALVYPLLSAGLLPKNAALHCLSLTGYTGGGKAMIADYESPERTNDDALRAPGLYALAQSHKHLPEMRGVAGLELPPVFCPVLADFPRGMEVIVPLHRAQLRPGTARADVLACYEEACAGEALIRVGPASEEDVLSANQMAGRDSMRITVEGNDERMTLIARFDNLGKGASGAALQCMNLMLGAKETEGLVP
ncbi:MAG: N-acetyl-gamma-glutamyl-phosphate reductase [Oscillospiraceae bacterium]|nr:N-acetyl-gamma-glutamyl-phosphate reductase [Oscillospiraceae bacterium]